MKATLTELRRETSRILGPVIHASKKVVLTEHGRNIAAIVPQARAGTVKALGITTAKRSPHAPEYPPIGDTVKGYDTTSWIGVGVRAGTPKEICDKIEAGVKVICQDKLLKDRLATLVSESVGGGAAEFAQFVADERKKWGGLIAEQKIKME